MGDLFVQVSFHSVEDFLEFCRLNTVVLPKTAALGTAASPGARANQAKLKTQFELICKHHVLEMPMRILLHVPLESKLTAVEELKKAGIRAFDGYAFIMKGSPGRVP